MGTFTGDRVTRDLSKYHQNGHGPEPEDIMRYALSGPASEATSGSGGMIRMDGAAIHVRQPIYPAYEVTLQPKRLDPRLIGFHDFDQQTVAPYNRLVISLIAAAASRQIQRVLIASANHGDGRTSVTLNLAAALSRARQRVLVVESDFLRPSALRLLGVDAEA